MTDTKPVTIKDPNYTTPRDSALPSGQLRDGEPIWLLDLKPGGMPAGNN